MPRQPADTPSTPVAISGALREFLATEAASGLALALATVAALVWANSPWQSAYEDLWHSKVGGSLGGWTLRLDLRHWVNDGLMAVFFLVVGLEIKRELVLGELRDRRRAALPVVAAVGGMVVPALLYVAVTRSGEGLSGWGIPMATDIAFALGVLAVFAPAIPSAIRLFLLTLAIVDDIGAIVVIAVVYSHGVDPWWLAAAVAVLGLFALARVLGVATMPVFAVLGVALWVAVHASGVHATIAGVALGMMAPTVAQGEGSTRLERLEDFLHPWSSFAIVPVFALANAGISLSADAIDGALSSSVTLAVVVGLVVGKTAGISGAAWLACRTGIAELSPEVRWPQLIGVAALGGIGFTVSLFITTLAFEDEVLVANAKVGILAGSLVAMALGGVLLRGHR